MTDNDFIGVVNALLGLEPDTLLRSQFAEDVLASSRGQRVPKGMLEKAWVGAARHEARKRMNDFG